MVSVVNMLFFLWIFQSIIVDLDQEESKINEFGWFNFQVKRIRQVKIVKLHKVSLEYLIVLLLKLSSPNIKIAFQYLIQLMLTNQLGDFSN
jgi:hypothetical protein